MAMTRSQKKRVKTMSNRVFLYSALIFVFILLYDAWLSDYPEIEPHEQEYTQEIPETQDMPETQITTEGGKDIQPILPKARVDNKEKFIQVLTDSHNIKISLTDGSIIYAELLRYPIAENKKEEKVKLLDTTDRHYIAKVGLQAKRDIGPKEFFSDMQSYNILDKESLDVILTGQSEQGNKITKTYSFKKNSHLIKIKQQIKNVTSGTTFWRQFATLERGEEKNQKRLLYTYTGAAYYDEDEKFTKIDFDEIAESNLILPLNSGWISMLEHYFLTAWIPYDDNEKQNSTLYTRHVLFNGEEIFLIGSVNDYKKILPTTEDYFVSRLYIGPKNQNELSSISDELVLTVDYGALTFLAAPLFWILEKLYLFIGNWGWAIVFLTILIKLLFFKLSETSYRSMAKMKKLNPRMQALKERFGDDKKKYSEALMKMYKEEKVNPLGGCLPILIQIPVFIALYWVLIESVEMRQAPFVAWIKDLSSADPLYILPISMGITMYIQQKLNPTPVDAMQQKIFMVLPFVFTILFATFPSGLVLYWLTNNVLSIGQQHVINKRVMNL